MIAAPLAATIRGILTGLGPDLFVLVGLAIVVYGVSLFSVRSAIITSGVILVLLGIIVTSNRKA